MRFPLRVAILIERICTADSLALLSLLAIASVGGSLLPLGFLL